MQYRFFFNTMFFIELIIILTKLVVITRIMYKQYARIKIPDSE